MLRFSQCGIRNNVNKLISLKFSCLPFSCSRNFFPLAFPPGIVAKDEVEAVQVGRMQAKYGEVGETETGTAEATGKAAARLSRGPWQGLERAQSLATTSGRR